MAVYFATNCYADHKECYQWKDCQTWWNETRGCCESICDESDKFKRGSLDCTKPCLSNGFCVGIRRKSNLCLCESDCPSLPYCMSFMYEDCEKHGEILYRMFKQVNANKIHFYSTDDPCNCIEINPWETVKVEETATTKKKNLLRGILLQQTIEVRKNRGKALD